MDEKISYIPFSFPGIERIRCAFGYGAGTEPLGDGNVSLTAGSDPQQARNNRLALRRRLGFSSWHSLRQVHGTMTVFDPRTDNIDRPGEIEADGLATSRPGQALVIKTADCQPILLAHRSGGHVAALHVGWRGNVADYPGKGVAAFCARYGLRPEDLLAVRGPSLGPAASEFVHFEKEFGPAFRDYYDPHTRTADLWRLTRDQLAAAGLAPRAIFSLDLCTASLPEFYSYRRDKACGRQGSLIWIAA